METKTDQASTTALHTLSQHHQQQQQHPSSSSGSSSSNKGMDTKTNDMLPSVQQETSLPSTSSSMAQNSSLPQVASTASRVEEISSSSFGAMTLPSLPLLTTSADLQFTHRPYNLQHHHHTQHASTTLAVNKDAEASTSSSGIPLNPRLELSEQKADVAMDFSTFSNGSTDYEQCQPYDSRDPRSRSLRFDSSSTADAPKSSAVAATASSGAVVVSPSTFTLSEYSRSSSSTRPLQPVEINAFSPMKQLGGKVGASFVQNSTPFKSLAIGSAHKAQTIDRRFTQSSNSPSSTIKARRMKQVQATPGYSLEPSFTVTAPVESISTIQERRRSSLGDELIPIESKRKSSKHIIGTDTFQLQPVPACKRRKQYNSATIKNSIVKSTPEKRRRKEHHHSTAISSGGLSIKTSGFPASSLHRTFDSQPVPIQSETRGAARHEGNTWIAPVVPVQQQSNVRISRPRLSRTQSLPNLKAKPVVDISAPALHRLIMPARLAEYLSLLRSHAKRQEMGEVSTTQHSPQQSSPQSDRPYNSGNIPSAHPSQLKSRNGYCSTTVDALGNVKSIFVPSLHPPITRQTLKELDLHEILKNPQLRHDIVFDSNVQFRPNFDGERGKKKREIGNKYWFAVQREIESGCTCTSFVGKSLLPCACGRGDGSGKEATNKFTSSLSSVPSPNLVDVANYAHSGSTFGALHSNGKGNIAAPTPTTASIGTPMTSFGVRGSRVPSRLPLLIQELRAICLSVLPTPASSLMASTEIAKTPTTGNRTIHSAMQSMASQMSQRQAQHAAAAAGTSPSSARSTAATILTPTTCASAVSTHHLLIAQALDANLITQQIAHGVLDIANLMSFLGSILKQHCAPMRDEVIEKMIKTVCEDGNVALGLRMCFEILELMKLDIANHQLRSSRTYLIETAVDFENRWFREQLHHRKMQLDRTTQWYLSIHRQLKALPSSATLSRTDLISASIDAGFMQLIFDPAHSRLPTSPTSSTDSKTNAPLPVLILGVTPSSAIHSHPCVNSYPETFQFDAFRLMSFHGDVTDITIVYMLLLLFRQLACSTSSLSVEPLSTSVTSAKAMEKASKIASARSNNVKSEIWTLLHEADLEITAAGGISQSAITLPMPRTPSATGIAARLLNQSAFTSSQKLENSAWRKAMGNVVLQIAARAIEVQIEARSTEQTAEIEDRSSPLPSEETIKLLTSWMDTNLRVGSRLHVLCQDRIKSVIAAFLRDSSSRQAFAATTASRGDQSAGQSGQSRKRSASEEEEFTSATSKRIRLEDGAANAEATTPCATTKGNIETAIQKGGLEPFTAEIKLLSERITKVKSFHLRVFQSLYETMALDA